MADRVISKDTQEYLETLFILSKNGGTVDVKEVAEYMAIPLSSVRKMVRELADKGYINYFSAEEIVLTDSGRKIGAKMSRKHRLLERFLHDFLRLGKDVIHAEACGMEHVLSDETETALCQFLGHPSRCPDGDKLIQPCDLPFSSCEDCLKARDRGLMQVGKRNENLVSIADLKEHEEGKVVFIRGDSKVLRRLLDMGITTSTMVHIIKSAPFGGPVEIAVRGSKLALGREIASDVFIEVVRDGEKGK